MSHNLKLAEDREQMIPDWIRSQVDTWEQGWRSLLQLGPILSTAVPPEEVSASTVQENIGEALRAACENRKVHPDGVDPAQSPFGESPAVIMNAINRAWEGLFALQKTSLGIKEREEDTSIPGGGPSEPSPETANAMFAGFKEEFLKILNIPPLGITRFYQERINKTLETYTSFQSALSEFFQLLTLPLEKASDTVQEELSKAGKDGPDRTGDSQLLYRLWIGKLEEYYLSLLRSPRYTETLAKTLSALYDYRSAKKKFMLDILQEWPIATSREMEEVCKDLYLLKKRFRKLEKEVRCNEADKKK